MDRYFSYLDTVQGRLPSGVFAFASNPRHYDLESHESLHDAWMEYFTIREPSSGLRKERREIEIECCLLGPYHDLKIVLEYSRVRAYSLTTPEGYRNPPAFEAGHGDLLMHEVRLDANNSVVHEFLYSRGAVLLITCEDFDHRIEPVEQC